MSQRSPTPADADRARRLHLRAAAAARSGKLAEAADDLRAAAMLQRDNDGIWVDRWQVAKVLQRGEEELECLVELARLRPDDVNVVVVLGKALRERGRDVDAVAAFRRCGTAHADDAAFRLRLANALLDAGEFAAAEEEARAAVHLTPTSAAAQITLGATVHQQDKLDEAINLYRAVLAVDPNAALAYSNLSDALARLEQFDKAEAAARRAAELEPGNSGYWMNVSAVLNRAGSPEGTLSAARQAIAIAPDNYRAHVNAGMALLTMGRWDEGFPEFEWRTRELSPPASGRRTWDGSPLDGKAIVLRSEQGFGDTIQFVRYAAQLRERFGAGRVIAECPLPLRDLLSQASGIDQVIVHGETPSADAECELFVMSLPHLFGTTVETVPANVPYLRVDPTRIEKFRPLVRPADSLRVGIVWAGNPAQRDDRRRSCPPAALAPLLRMPGVSFHSLQKGSPADRDMAFMTELAVIDLGTACADFADLAAAMSLLDLVITVCTAPAHLAGALGVPVWTMLPHVCDWRWLLDRRDTPWYPTMRLFRQPRHGDWAAVVGDVAEALRVHSSAK
jgi:tetratricopeptide (TPR) repeat protein